MSNYTPTGNPIAETRGTSSLIRNEFVLIQQAVNSKADPSTTNTYSALQTFSTITVTGLATLSGGGAYTGAHDFTGGSITVSTQSPGTNNTSAASTAFVTAAVAVETARATTAENLLAPKASPTFTGTVTVPTPVNPTDAATKQYVDNNGMSTGVKRNITDFTATGGQTVFSATYVPGYIDVFVNGVKLQSADFTATNGTSVTLGTACVVNDAVTIIAYEVLSLSLVNIAGGSAYALPYQQAANTTAFLSAGTAGQFLQSGGPSAAPVWADLFFPHFLLMAQGVI